jgi:7,8-didemethyl-8-hydroxy-5-deazariboflavin synthase CofG subunit
MGENPRDRFCSAERLNPPDFARLLADAAALRDRHWGRTITYSRKVFIPLTTMCRDECGYCVFVQRPGSPKARYMTPDEVLEVARRGRDLGCKEALFSLGEKPELRYPEAREALDRLGYARTTDYLRDMCGRVLDETGLLPHANAGTLSDEELEMLKPVTGSMGMMLENVSRRLTRKGQAHHACPDKVPVQRLRTLERAGRHEVPFTTGLLIGIGETWAERVDTLLAIQEIHRRFGHIQEVIIQNFRAKPGIAMAHHPEPALDDMLKTLAVARLILDPAISLQAPPNLERDYPAYIAAGLNDWGGISPVTIDHINPERAWPQIEALRQATESAGYRLQERLTIYPAYLRRPESFMAPRIAPYVQRLARHEDGLAAAQCLT